MVIISKNESAGFRRYGSSQFRYAMTYVFITFVVLLLLNIYCTRTSHQLFYQNKQVSMIEKCHLAADEISQLEVLNQENIADALSRLGSMTSTRMLITDRTGLVLYDSQGSALQTYAIFPEVARALNSQGHRYGYDAFSWHYHDGDMRSSAATPIISYDTIAGCVYITEHDPKQGELIRSLQLTILQITVVLELVVIFFALIFSRTFSRRMRQIMTSMRIIQEGDYTHKVDLGGRDELTVLGSEVNDLTERLNTSEQKRRRFVSDASHELKTPLASIKLLTDSILQNDMDMETVREFVGDIGDEAERLNRMTAKLLSLTKVDGEPLEDSEIIPMAPTIHRCVRRLTGIARAAEISVELHLEQDSPVLIPEDDLYQVAYNLIENGIKYNLPGGKLIVTLSRDEDNAYLEVRDTGMGIPEEAIPHLFERFYRVDKARSRQSGGSGLGLAIVRAIVLRNRGDIQVSSVPDQGSCFTVSFPAFDTEVDPE